MARLRAAPGLQALRPALASAGFERRQHDASRNPRRVQPPLHAHGGAAAAPQPDAERHALIVGAGLAGCATAWALAEQGWRSTLIDRAARAGDGKARATRPGCSTASSTRRTARMRASTAPPRCWRSARCSSAIDSGTARGSTQGLLRLDTRGLGVQAMRDELAALQLPPDYVQALDAAAGQRALRPAAAAPGLVLSRRRLGAAGGAGAVVPAAGRRHAAEFRGGLQVQSLRAARRPLATARCRLAGSSPKPARVVLANAADALRLMEASHWPVQSVRGQISL